MSGFTIYDPNTGKPVDVDKESEKQVPTTISYGYDRTERSWCIILEDQHKYQIGDADYVATWGEASNIISNYQTKYNIDDEHIEKVRAY